MQDRPRTNRLLDVGCGLGQFRKLFTQFKYSGFDIYPYKWVQYVADFTKPWQVQNKSQDIVILSNTLEHTHDPVLMIKEAYRVLKPGGIVVGSVPHWCEVHEEPYDFLRYTYIMLHKLFADAGFGSCKIDPLGTPFGDYKWLQVKFFKQIDKSFLSKLFIKCSLYLNSLCEKSLKKAKQDVKYCRRYGFVAEKY